MSDLKLDIERFSKDFSETQMKNEKMIKILIAGLVIVSIGCFNRFEAIENVALLKP